jgi:hypothetical protein
VYVDSAVCNIVDISGIICYIFRLKMDFTNHHLTNLPISDRNGQDNFNFKDIILLSLAER